MTSSVTVHVPTKFKTTHTMTETAKTHVSRVRNNDYYRYLHGDILDVGCGPDLLQVPNGTVTGWDLEDGDAQYLATVPDKRYDACHNSHLLEHVVDVPTTMKTFSRVIKDGGTVYSVVPSWSLYEKYQWPSRFNGDHKSSFDLIDCDRPTDHPHYNLNDMIRIGLEAGLTLVDARLVCDGYVWNQKDNKWWDVTRHGGLAQCTFIFQKL